jgi:hypothetical protein
LTPLNRISAPALDSLIAEGGRRERVFTGLSVPRSNFVVGSAFDVDLAVVIDRYADVDRSTTNETVFDVLLIRDRIVDDQFDRFATVRTQR